MNQKLVNRLVLKWAADQVGIPFAIDDAREHVNDLTQGIGGDFVPKALAYLTQAGFLARVERTAAARPLWTCTAPGAQQAAREVPAANLDPMIWGS